MRMGYQLARMLRSGNIVSLVGDLGTGKTVFVKGIARGLGIRVGTEEVVSPTFVLVKEYPCKIPLYHIDLYRLDVISASDAFLIDEYLHRDGIACVEWGEKFQNNYGSNYFEVKFRHKGPSTRQIRVRKILRQKINEA